MSEAVMDRLKTDQLAARKSRDPVIADLLGTVIGECTTRSKNMQPMRALTDAEVISVVQRTLKGLDDTITLIKGDRERDDQLARLEREREHLRRYMPPDQLGDEEVETIALRLHAIMGMKQIMDYLRANYPGRYDAKRAYDIVRSVVNSPEPVKRGD